MQATQRLFVSLHLPAACQDAVAAIQQKRHGITWTPPEQFHLTMRFLGDVETALAQRIEEELAKVRVEPFLLPLAGAGRFPPRGLARVLWVGVGNGHTRLFQLRQKIDDAVLAAGWRGELRNFDPHITVGRVRAEEADPVVVEKWPTSHRDFEGPPFRVDAFQLMSSDLSSAGAVHKVVRRFPLGGSAPALVT
ncbi:MAG: RNA 2',3'-cyclic phosphodiesterase [Nibricoccus sp.]